jgi:selenocysteine lyase/cysteine desulfurase
LNLTDEIGIANIQERALELNRILTSRLEEGGWRVLSPLENENTRSAETLVQVDEPAAVVHQLFRRGVIVTQKPEGIRVATHFFNNEDDIERLMAAMSEMRRVA